MVSRILKSARVGTARCTLELLLQAWGLKVDCFSAFVGVEPTGGCSSSYICSCILVAPFRTTGFFCVTTNSWTGLRKLQRGLHMATVPALPQQGVIASQLTLRRSCCLHAPTGTGKTLCFLLPLLQRFSEEALCMHWHARRQGFFRGTRSCHESGCTDTSSWPSFPDFGTDCSTSMDLEPRSASRC